MNKQALIIVGGGISGLTAARQLVKQYEIILLEALPRFGGRIWTIEAEDGFPARVEGGAELVHGEAEQTIKLLEEAKIPMVQVEGGFYRKKNGELQAEEDQIEGWTDLLKKMGGLEQDLSLSAFLNSYFGAPEFESLRKQAIAFAGGFDLADKDEVSVKYLYGEWSHQSEDHRVQGGYGRLVQFLVKDCEEKGCQLISNMLVKEIRWSAGHVQLLTDEGKIYEADKCLLTVPLGILQNRHLQFLPAIHKHLEAADQIGFGTVIKMALLFSEGFWKQDAGFFLSGETIPVWWTQFPAQTPLLTGWAGGPGENDLSLFREEELLEKALESLAAIFDVPIPEIRKKLISWRIFNWKKQYAALGAYSYGTLQSPKALKILNTPIANTLYFAGEGLYSGPHPGTVEAAIVQVQQVIEQLIV